MSMQCEWKCESQCSLSLYVRRDCTIRGNSVCSSACYLARALSTCCSLFCPVKPRCVSRTQQSFLSLMDQTLDVLHHSNIPSNPDRILQFLLSLGLIFCPPSPTTFSRPPPQMRENGVPQDSLDAYYLIYSVLPDLSDSFWPYRSNAIFSPEDVDVSYARDVTSEYFLVIDLHLDAQVDSVFFVLLASGVLRFVIPVGSSVDSDLNQTLW